MEGYYMSVGFIHFLAMLIIAGFLLRLAQLYLVPKDHPLGKALAFVY